MQKEEEKKTMKALLTGLVTILLCLAGLLVLAKKDSALGKEFALQEAKKIIQDPQMIQSRGLPDTLTNGEITVVDTDFYLDRTYRATFVVKKDNKEVGVLFAKTHCRRGFLGVCLFNNTNTLSLESIEFRP